MGDDPVARPRCGRALVQEFTAGDGTSYNDIRAMLAAAEAVDFLTLRCNYNGPTPWRM